MNMDINETSDKIVDLLVEQSLHGLNDEERLQLDVLLAGIDDAHRAQLEAQLEAALAAAGNASVLGLGGAEEAPPPARLLAKLEADADRFFGTGGAALDTGGQAVTPLRPRRESRTQEQRSGAADNSTATSNFPVASRGQRWAAWSGWAVAAMLLITVWMRNPGPSGEPVLQPPVAAEARMALLAETGTLQIDWAPSAWEDFEGVRGDVSWNDERQEGYLRLVGMPANDPARSQYQLWIVDPGRDVEPVDGGVFDIPPGATEVVVPIRATLAVDRPAAFAITREQPGGVVVSEGPLLVVASRS